MYSLRFSRLSLGICTGFCCLTLFLFAPATGYTQDASPWAQHFDSLMQIGESHLYKRAYSKAINNFQAAGRADPQRFGEADKRVKFAFSKIEAEKDSLDKIRTKLAGLIDSLKLNEERLTYQRERLSFLLQKSERLVEYFFNKNTRDATSWAFNTENGKFSVIDRSGEQQGQGFVWEEPLPFKDGMAIAKRNGKYWFVDEQATSSTEGYSWLHPTDHDLYMGKQNRETKYAITKEGFKLNNIRPDTLQSVKPISDSLTYRAYYYDETRQKQYELIRESGTIVGDSTYEFIGSLTEDIFYFRQGQKYGLLEKSGKQIIPASVGRISKINDELLSISEDRKWGLMNLKGEILKDPIFVGSPYEFGKYIRTYVYETGTRKRLYGLLDQTGKELLLPSYTRLVRILQGNIAATKENQIIIFDSTMNKVNELPYTYITRFSDELLIVQDTSKKYGLINQNFQQVVPCIANSTRSFRILGEDMIIVTIDRKSGLWMRNGAQVLDTKYSSIQRMRNDDRIRTAFREEGKTLYGLYSAKLDTLISEGTFSSILPLKGDIYSVKRDTLYGLWNVIQRQFVVQPKYTAIQSKGDFAILIENSPGSKKNLHHLYHLEEARIVQKFLCDDLSSLSKDYFRIKKGKRYQLINHKGKYVLKKRYNRISTSRGYLIASRNKGEKGTFYGLFDENGKTIVKPKYDHITYFGKEDSMDRIYFKVRSVVDKENKVYRYGIVNGNGKWSLPIKYTQIKLQKKHALVSLPDTTQGLVHLSTGTEIVPSGKFKSIQPINDSLYKVKDKDGLSLYKAKYETLVLARGLYTSLRFSVQERLSGNYDAISKHSSLRPTLKVKKENQYGLLDMNGKFVPSLSGVRWSHIRKLKGTNMTTYANGYGWGLLDDSLRTVISTRDGYDSVIHVRDSLFLLKQNNGDWLYRELSPDRKFITTFATVELVKASYFPLNKSNFPYLTEKDWLREAQRDASGISSKDKEALSAQLKELENELAKIETKRKNAEESLKSLLKAEYRTVGKLSEDRIWANKGSRWELINRKNPKKRSRTFSFAREFKGDYNWVKETQDTHWELINQKGERVFKLQDAIKTSRDLIDFEDQYSWIKPEKDRKWKAIDLKGKLIDDKLEVDGVKPFKNGQAWVMKDKKWGLYQYDAERKKGNMILPAIYEKAGTFVEDRAWLSIKDTVFLVNQQGEILSKNLYDQYLPFSNGKSWVKQNNQWMILDGMGTVLDSFTNIQQVRPFDELGYAQVKQDDKWGILVITDEAEMIVKPEFSNISNIDGFPKEIIKVRKNGKWGLVFIGEETIIEPKYEEFTLLNPNAPYIWVKEGGYQCLLIRGRDRIENYGEKYADAKVVNQDIIWLKKNDKWGMRSSRYRPLITPFTYDQIVVESPDLSRAGVDGQWTFFDGEGQEYGTINFEDFKYDKKSSMGRIKREGRWQLVYFDQRRNRVIFLPEKYSNIKSATEQSMWVTKGINWELFDEKANRISMQTDSKAKSITSALKKTQTHKDVISNKRDFKEGTAWINLNTKWGLIDKTGKLLISPQYDRIENFHKGVAKVKQGNMFYLINPKGQKLAGPYRSIGSFKDGVAITSQNSYQGLVAYTGKELLPPVYSKINKKAYHLYELRQESRKGFVALSGYMSGQLSSPEIAVVKILAPDYETTGTDYYQNLFPVKNNGKVGFMYWEKSHNPENPEGKLKIPMRYDGITAFKEVNGKKVARVFIEEQDMEFLINEEGEMLIKIQQSSR